jgi:hypothetical protein
MQLDWLTELQSQTVDNLLMKGVQRLAVVMNLFRVCNHSRKDARLEGLAVMLGPNGQCHKSERAVTARNCQLFAQLCVCQLTSELINGPAQRRRTAK